MTGKCSLHLIIRGATCPIIALFNITPFKQLINLTRRTKFALARLAAAPSAHARTRRLNLALFRAQHYCAAGTTGRGGE